MLRARVASSVALISLLLCGPARAQPVASVPAGARAVTVMVCDQPDGCVQAYQALADHCTALGVPLLDFDDVAMAGPAGGDARAALELALAEASTRPSLASLEAARAAMQGTPLTLPPAQPFQIWLTLGAARFELDDAAGADAAFLAAAAASGARVYDLPALSPGALDRYLELASRPAGQATLQVVADHPGALVFIDGRLVGPAPVEAPVVAGWHRISVERPGRRAAWVGEVTAPAGQALSIAASVAEDDAPAALEAAVIGVIAGTPAPPDVGQRLGDWARTQGLSTVRFVQLVEPGAFGRVPQERVQAKTGLWDLRATWLHAGSGRFAGQGPGPTALRRAADPERFSLGLQAGYSRLQQRLSTGPDPHDHLDVQLVGLLRFSPTLAVDARAGLWRAAQPWYLYRDWLSHELFPVAAGLRWTDPRLGLYGGVQGLAVVPVAVGGQLFAGWTWRPSVRWRLGLEAHGGYTDVGPTGGASTSVTFAG